MFTAMMTQPSFQKLRTEFARPVPVSRDLAPARTACARRSCVPQLVAAAAAASPEAVALSFGGRTLTYAELDVRASHLGAYLRSLGAGPEAPVAICLERSFDYVIAALAAWKAGAAYLPIDPSWPAERRAFVAKDAQAHVFIGRSSEELARTTEPDSAGRSRVPRSLEGRAGPVRAFEELAQNGVRRETVPDQPGGARRTLCASEELAQEDRKSVV